MDAKIMHYISYIDLKKIIKNFHKATRYLNFI
jgi:hypothetical protein